MSRSSTEPRRRATRPSLAAWRSARLVVARVVPASPASSCWVIGRGTPSSQSAATERSRRSTAGLGRYEEHFHKKVRDPPQFRGKRGQEHSVDRRLLESEPLEFLTPDRQRLRGLECSDCRRAFLTLSQQGQLPDEPPRTDQAEHGGVAEIAERPHGQTSIRHQVERFSRVAGMKDDVALGEALASAVAQESAPLVLGELGEKGPFHNAIFASPAGASSRFCRPWGRRKGIGLLSQAVLGLRMQSVCCSGRVASVVSLTQRASPGRQTGSVQGCTMTPHPRKCAARSSESVRTCNDTAQETPCWNPHISRNASIFTLAT